MSKVKILDRRSEKSILGERDLLSKLHHPFIVNMLFAFQDYENLYLVMDLLTGGDLRYHLCRNRKFTEEETKFFISCIILGLEYIHNNKIIHRDIKPENLVCDENGYIRITDFGVAKVHKEDNSSETSGTPGYMAPEVLMARNHSYVVDFFAIGIMGYEFMFGQRPYLGRNRKEIKHLVLKKQAKIEEKPDDWSDESVDFINKCLKRKDTKRLGYIGGAKELKEHEWFKNFEWDNLLKKTLCPPFVPKKGGNYDKKYCEMIEKISEETMERYQNFMSKKNFGKIFEGYTYVNYETLSNIIGVDTVTRTSTNSKTSKIGNNNTTNHTTNNDKKNLINNSNNKNNCNNENGKNIINGKNNFQQSFIQKEQKVNNNNENNNENKFDVNNFSMYQDESPFPSSNNNKKANIDKNTFYHIKMGNQRKKNYKNNNNSPDQDNNLNNLVSSYSVFNSNNNNNMQKFNSFNEINKRNIRSGSVDSSNSKIQNNYNNNGSMSGRVYSGLKLNMNKKMPNKVNKNESFSSSKCEKIRLKLKGGDLNSSMLTPKNSKKNNNFIQLRQIGGGLFPFYLQNVNKGNFSPFNIYNFKNKGKLNLSQLKFKLNKRDNHKKYLLSPKNSGNSINNMKKNESSTSLNNGNYLKINPKFYSTGKTHLVRNNSNLGNIISDNNKRFGFSNFKQQQKNSNKQYNRNFADKKLSKNSSGIF